MDGKKIIVFGDIHGCYKAVEQAVLLSQANDFQAVFLGDYVDRGFDSVKTLKILMTAKKNNPDWIFLRGNHDQMLLDLIERKAVRNGIASLSNGSKFSYAETTLTQENLENESIDFKENVQEFLKSLNNYYENENFIFVHNPLRDDSVSVAEKTLDELIWNYSLEPIWNGKIFIHGHALVTSPTKTNRGININTECGYGGYLTGLLVEKKAIQSFYSISEDGIRVTKKKLNGFV